MVLDFNSHSALADRFVDLIDKAIDDAAQSETRREYLGGSAIGEPCLRRLQYEYQNAPKDEGAGFEPRTRRIFHRGHQGEDWMAEWIRAAGFDLKTHKPSGHQFGFEDCDGRFKGHIDGVIIDGPDGFKFPALWENKVLGAKGFGQIVKHGVAKAYPKYAAQVATYQAYMQLAENPAFFTVLNADTMEIHLELIPFDQALAQECADKAARIFTACDHEEVLPRITDDPASFACKWCPYKGVCHG
jgi:hypothetical protein